MIPYFEQPIWHIGPLSIHAFGVSVAAALLVGLAAASRRFRFVGLDVPLAERAGRWTIVGGLLGAHLFSVLFYFPEKLRDDPWLLLRIWEDISSFGSMLGGLAGASLFFATRREASERRGWLQYLDAIAFVFPSGLAIGRLGCALAHDHPGVITSFPLAVSLRSDAALAYVTGVYDTAGLPMPTAARTMGFHDLGLYEFLLLALVIVPVFAWLNRKPRPTGFFLAAFAALYLPVRFCLDTLRVADTRYAGLTPAQWVAATVLLALPFTVVRHRALRYIIAGATVLAGAWACGAVGR